MDRFELFKAHDKEVQMFLVVIKVCILPALKTTKIKALKRNLYALYINVNVTKTHLLCDSRCK